MPKIMIVDDNRVNRHLIASIMERGGYTDVLHVENGQQVLDKIDDYDPDLILLDLIMPEMNGFDVCKKLREIPKYQFLPIMAMTNLNTQEDCHRAYDVGMSDYIRKPINAYELLSRVNSHMKMRLRIKELETALKPFADSKLWDSNLGMKVSGITAAHVLVARASFPNLYPESMEESDESW